MYIIVGLGNPGPKYIGTRHNVGFDAIDTLAIENNIEINKIKFSGIYGKGQICGEQVLIIKPMTYMNLSGDCVTQVMQFYKESIKKLIIIYDDISLDVGRLRIRKTGSAGGHNGIKHIIARLGSKDFARIKIGVGDKPTKMDLADYVLSRFNGKECESIDMAIMKSVKAIEDILKYDIDKAMNDYNG